jgi:uncharacterized membrane protein
MNRRMKLIFTLSVLLNIVFVGVGIGMFYRFCQEIPIPGQISPEARHFVARTFQEGRKEIKPLIDEVKADRAKVEKILTAEQFDAKAYDKAVDEMLDSRNGVTRKRAEIMGRALADLPAEDRQKFAKRVLDGLEGHRPRRGGYHRQMMKDTDNEKGEQRPSGEVR